MKTSFLIIAGSLISSTLFAQQTEIKADQSLKTNVSVETKDISAGTKSSVNNNANAAAQPGQVKSNGQNSISLNANASVNTDRIAATTNSIATRTGEGLQQTNAQLKSSVKRTGKRVKSTTARTAQATRSTVKATANTAGNTISKTNSGVKSTVKALPVKSTVKVKTASAVSIK